MATGKDLRKALKTNDLTMEAAAEKLSISRPTLYNWVNKGELEEDVLHNVKEKLGIDLEASPRPFIEQRRQQKLSDEAYMVPFVDVPAQAGYSKAYQQRDYIETLRKYPILPDVDPTGAVWRYFQIEGPSMEPGFKSGDIILCSQVYKDDWSQFANYHTYVIVTETELWIKDVYRLNFDEWILLSQNSQYRPFKVHVNDVKQLWVMRRHVKARAEKPALYNIEEIKKELK